MRQDATRPQPDTVEARIVWISGPMTPGTIHPRILHRGDVADYARIAERVLSLSAEGHRDRTIGHHLAAEGFRSARSLGMPPTKIGVVRRAHGQRAVDAPFRTAPKIDGQWTILGLSTVLGVHRNWLYARIRNGKLPAARHPITGHYLVPDDPGLLRQQRDRCSYR